MSGESAPLVLEFEILRPVSVHLDGVDVPVFFDFVSYYIVENMTEGEHILNVTFESILGDSSYKDLQYELYGPALRYLINVYISLANDTTILLAESSDWVISDLPGKVKASRELYAVQSDSLSYSWREYPRPQDDDISVTATASAELTVDEFILEVYYTLDFPGFLLQDIGFSDLGTLEQVQISQGFRWDDDARRECFRKYNSVNDSYRDHSIFLASRSRYSDLGYL